MTPGEWAVIAGAVVAALVVCAVVWRLVSKRQALPCPAWAIPLLENPWMNGLAGAETLLDRAGVEPGMRILDVGPGPGRLTVPAALRVGESGSVTALEIQPAMLERLTARLADKGLENVDVVLGGAGEGKVAAGAFDRAFLVTVLGEIVDKNRALSEIRRALVPGGILSVTEVLPDPHYQSRKRVRRLAEAVGLRPVGEHGTWLAFTLDFERP